MRANPQVIDGLRVWLANLWPVALLLLIPAGLAPGGTWIWTSALEFVAVYGAMLLVSNVGLAILRPAHFKVRRQGVVARKDQKQPLIDAVGTALFIGYWLAWLAFIPLDVFTLHLLPRPAAWVCVAGGALALLGTALGNLAVWQNQFAAPNVQDQSGDGQRVIDTGVYSLIRHPIYAGNLLLYGGLALWLGSLHGLHRRGRDLDGHCRAGPGGGGASPRQSSGLYRLRQAGARPVHPLRSLGHGHRAPGQPPTPIRSSRRTPGPRLRGWA